MGKKSKEANVFEAWYNDTNMEKIDWEFAKSQVDSTKLVKGQQLKEEQEQLRRSKSEISQSLQKNIKAKTWENVRKTTEKT